MNDPVPSQGVSDGTLMPAHLSPLAASSAPAKLPRVLTQPPALVAAPEPPQDIVTLPRFCGSGMLRAYSATGSR